jgi:hypothetical protein
VLTKARGETNSTQLFAFVKQQKTSDARLYSLLYVLGIGRRRQRFTPR